MMDWKRMLGIRKREAPASELQEIKIERRIEKMAGDIINKRYVAYLNENGETSKIPPEAFAVTEHMEEHEMKDNGIETGKILRIYYSYLLPVSEEEPEPKEEEPKRPVAVARRK